MAWTQEPRSRLRRLVSNIEIYDGPDGLIQTFSNFHLTELRANRRDPVEWIGRTEHRLRPYGSDFRLVFKKVMLINNDHEMTQLSCMV
jgi:3-phenylpropionate/cinnamic acid dioxygenase small subunit